MCIIAVSKRGAKQPTPEQIRKMFANNPDGAGYMYARDGKVIIHKGFMTLADLERQLEKEAFTEEDPVVYHFRISTQAGVSPTMTHPFPWTTNLETCEQLDVECPVGFAHNGIIHMTSDFRETRFSDTAFFITQYMTRLIQRSEDITDPVVINMIDHLTNSKWAIMEGFTGDIVTVGKFINQGGVLFSNESFKDKKAKKPPFNIDDFVTGYYYRG